jgi:DNA-binding GntR family transcriptional regulator
MRFLVDTTSATPIYAQIIAQVKHAIASGVLKPGDSLPSLRELAAQLRDQLFELRARRDTTKTKVGATSGRGR